MTKQTKHVLHPDVEHALSLPHLKIAFKGQPTLVSPALTIASDALQKQSFSLLVNSIDDLAEACSGASLWCPADPSVGPWAKFFSVFARAIGVRSVAGVEWWVRRQPASAGKNFHFDKDEHLMSAQQVLVAPLRSSVFYLTDIGGPTLIAAQTSTALGELCPPRNWLRWNALRTDFWRFQET